MQMPFPYPSRFQNAAAGVMIRADSMSLLPCPLPNGMQDIESGADIPVRLKCVGRDDIPFVQQRRQFASQSAESGLFAFQHHVGQARMRAEYSHLFPVFRDCSCAV